jgi:hypothetical protein
MLCEQSICVTIILTCDQCSRDWHVGCLMSPLGEVLVGKWFYLPCLKTYFCNEIVNNILNFLP